MESVKLFAVGGNQDDPFYNYGPELNRTGVAMMCLSFIAVILRFVSRRIGGQDIKIDDYLIVGGWLLSWSVSITQFIGVKYGLGRHIIFEASPENLRSFLITLYANQIIYILAVATIKFSILAFIRRAFHVPSTKIPTWIIAGIIISWLTALELVAIFSCQPIHGFWDRTQPAKCVNTTNFFWGVGIPNAITDFILLIFPMPFVWRLKMPNSQKVALSGVFGLGIFIVIISILHLITVRATDDSLDVTWTLVPIAIWNGIECNIGVVLACLSSMRPLLRKIMKQEPKGTAATGSTSGGSLSKHQWSNIKRTDDLEVSSFSRLQEDEEESRGTSRERGWNPRSGADGQTGVYDVEMGRMNKTMQTTVGVNRHV